MERCVNYRLAGQAALTKEIPLLMQSDCGFLALLGNHGDLALSAHDVKDSICRKSPWRKIASLFRYFAMVLPPSAWDRKDSRTKGCFLLVFTDKVPRQALNLAP
jgi:hypothetical protein